MHGQSAIEEMARVAMLQGLVFCEYFTYSQVFLTGTDTALAASGTTTANIQINADSDFLVQMLNLTAWTAAGTILNSPDYLITIIIAGSGRQLMNRAQHVLNICGNFEDDRVPHYLSMPKLISANTTVSITLENRTTTAANRVDVAFGGFKIFYNAGYSRQNVFHTL